MTSQKLLEYISQQLKMGKNQEQITVELINGGWKKEDIEHGFSSLNSVAPVAHQASTVGPLPSIGSLFLESFELLKQRVLVMFLSSFLPMLALFIAVLIAGGITFGIFKANTTAGVIAGIIFGIAAFATYFYSIFLVTASQLVALRDAPEKTGTIANLKRSSLVMWSVFLVGLLQSLVFMGGIILLIIPGIILMVHYGFASVIMVTEGKKGRAALAQSKAYVNGRGLKVFGRGLLLFLLYLIPYLALQFLSILNKDSFVLVTTVLILSVLIQIFFTFYSLCFQYTLYTHLKNTSGPTSHEQYMGGVNGWTIWGGVGGVIVIFGLVASVIFLSLNSARSKSRDARRMADVQQIAAAMELYYNENNTYPNKLNALEPYYIKVVPTAPMPADGLCTVTTNQYTYEILYAKQYNLSFCLGNDTNGYKSGSHIMTEVGIDPEITEPNETSTYPSYN